MLFIYFTIFLIYAKCTYSSFCGEDSLPYYFEVSNYGQLILGCSKPTCLNLRPSTFSKFFNVDGVVDGFVTVPKRSQQSFDITEKTECDSSFEAKKCLDADEWLGGIEPELNTTTSKNLSLRCCRNPAMKMAKFQKIVDISKNENFEGGDVYENQSLIAFDYISNIVKFENNNGINYELFINRAYCNLSFPLEQKKITKSNHVITEKLFQAPLTETDIINVENGEIVQNTNSLPSPDTVRSTNLEGSQDPDSLRPPQESVNQNPMPQEPVNQNPIPQEPVNQNPTSQVQQIDPNFQAPMPPSQQYQIQSTSLQQPFQSIPMQTHFYNPPSPQGQPSNAYGGSVNTYPSSVGAMCSPYLCFSADTKVTTFGGNQRRMDELNIGDWVLSAQEDGHIYGKVHSWLHKMPKIAAEFIEFTLDGGRSLKMTKYHYIYIGDCKNVNSVIKLKDVNYTMLHAGNVSLQDCLFVINGNFEMVETRIIKINVVEEIGIYSPLTGNGNIIVNSIFASCYSNADVHPLQTMLSYSTSKFQHFNSLFFESNNNLHEMDLIPGFGILFEIFKYHISASK